VLRLGWELGQLAVTQVHFQKLRPFVPLGFLSGLRVFSGHSLLISVVMVPATVASQLRCTYLLSTLLLYRFCGSADAVLAPRPILN